MRVKQKTVLMWVSNDILTDSVTPAFLPVPYFESECCLGDAANFPNKIPTLVMKERLAIRGQELQITDLWRVNSRVIDFG